MAQFRCLDIIWGLLNQITWEPKNNVQNDHPRSCIINQKVIMTQCIIIILGYHQFWKPSLPSSQSHQLEGRFPCGLLIFRYVCWIRVSPPWWDKVAEWRCWEVQIWWVRFRCFLRRDFPSCDFMCRRWLVRFTYVTMFTVGGNISCWISIFSRNGTNCFE